MFTRLRILTAVACVFWLSACAAPQTTSSPQDLLKSGWNEFTLGEFDRAVMRFDEALAKTAPSDDLHFQALYGLATTWNLRRPGEDPNKARELYRQILDAAPEDGLAAWSLLALARMKHLVPVGDEPNYDDVLKAYQEVIDRFPNHLAGKEAFIYLNSILASSLKESDARRALKLLEQFVQNESNEFIGPAYSLMAVCYTTLNMQDKRIWAEIQSLEKTEVDPTNPFTEFAWQYWNIATIAEFELGDFDTARKYYGKLIAEYPTDIRVFAAEQALKRMDDLEAKIRAEAAGGKS